MKNNITCALILSAVLFLAACSNGNSDIIMPPPAIVNDVERMTSPPSFIGHYVEGMNPPMPAPEYPVIDGSSSTVEMHAAIRAYLTDVYGKNARNGMDDR